MSNTSEQNGGDQKLNLTFFRMVDLISFDQMMVNALTDPARREKYQALLKQSITDKAVSGPYDIPESYVLFSEIQEEPEIASQMDALCKAYLKGFEPVPEDEAQALTEAVLGQVSTSLTGQREEQRALSRLSQLGPSILRKM